MANVFSFAQGNKTYITGIVAIIGAAAGCFTGQIDAVQAAQTGLIALIGMFLRSGITTEIRQMRGL